MCFSAPVSFATSGLLGAAGLASLKKSKKKTRLLASIPLIFAVQQFIEGLQWLTPQEGTLSIVLAYLFLFFAFLLWPIYIPLTVYVMEEKSWRKKALKWITVLGTLLSITLLVALFTIPLDLGTEGGSIVYWVNVPYYELLTLIYIGVVGLSPFLSKDIYLKGFGVLLIGTAFLSIAVFRSTFVSVWCFFAALLSVLILIYMFRSPRAAR